MGLEKEYPDLPQVPFRLVPSLASRSFSRRIFVYPACDLAEAAAAGKSVNIAASSDAHYRVSDDAETLSAIPAIWICTNTFVSLHSRITSGGDSNWNSGSREVGIVTTLSRARRSRLECCLFLLSG